MNRLPSTLLAPAFQVRHKSATSGLAKNQSTMNKKKKDSEKKKKKPRTIYRQYDLKDTEQFSLCDAMRFVKPPS